MKHVKSILFSKKGAVGTVGTVVGLIVALILFVGGIFVSGFLFEHIKLDKFADEVIAKAGEQGSVGNEVINKRIEELISKNGFNKSNLICRLYTDATGKHSYDPLTGKVQFGEIIKLQVEYKTEMKVPLGKPMPATFRVNNKSTKSQQYYKELEDDL